LFSDLFILLLGIIITFFSSLLLTNSVESLDTKTRLGTTFVGAIITPLFTSLPEMIVFFAAVFLYSNSQGEKIGIGTLYGQPFMTSSLSYGLVGFSILFGIFKKKRQEHYAIVNKDLSLPYIFISILFPFLYIPSLVTSYHIQFLFAIIFGISYFLFVYLSYHRRIINIVQEEVRPYLAKYIQASYVIIIQFVLTSIGLYVGTHLLIDALVSISTKVNVDPLGLSIIIIPLATAIPETLNAMIWGYKGKDSLAVSALVGEKLLYSTFYPALGLLTVEWISNIYSDFSIIFTTIISLIMWVYIRKKHIPLYAFFIGFLFFTFYSLYIFTQI